MLIKIISTGIFYMVSEWFSVRLKMPARRRFRRRYNKSQRAAYKKRSKRYRNRQQLLSVKTVKKIAEKVCREQPEVKFIHQSHFFANNAANSIFMNPSSQHVIVSNLINPTQLAQGLDSNQMVGEEVFCKGIKLNLILKSPRILNNSGAATNFGMSSYLEYHVRVISMKARGRPSAEIHPPDISTDWPDDLYTNKRDLLLREAEQDTFQTVYYQKFKVRPKPLSLVGASNTLVCAPVVHKVNKYIKINKRVKFTGTGSVDYDRSYFLWIYAYNFNQSIPAGQTVWGGDIDYCPRASWATTTYYTDS